MRRPELSCVRRGPWRVAVDTGSSGWDVPMSYVQVDTSFGHRREERLGLSAGAARPCTVATPSGERRAVRRRRIAEALTVPGLEC